MAGPRLFGRAAGAPGPEVEEPAGSDGEVAPGAGATLHELAASRSPRDKVVSLPMRTALRHVGDGIRWAGLDEESTGTGRRRAGAHSLRHTCRSALAHCWWSPVERGVAVAGPCECTGYAAGVPAHRGQRLWHGRCAISARRGQWSIRVSPRAGNKPKAVSGLGSFARPVVLSRGYHRETVFGVCRRTPVHKRLTGANGEQGRWRYSGVRGVRSTLDYGRGPAPTGGVSGDAGIYLRFVLREAGRRGS